MRIRVKLLRTLSVGAIVMLSVLGSQPSVVVAGPNRWYSVAYEQGFAYAQTGVKTFHAYNGLTTTAGTNCSIKFANEANPIYLTQWINFNLPSTQQVEVGYGYQCGGVSYLFWGYRTALSNWFPMGTENVGFDSNGHTFEIVRTELGGYSYWDMKIDGVLKSTYQRNVAGVFVDAGLETTDSGLSAAVPNHWFSQLKLQQSNGPWLDWGYQLSTQVDGGAGLCGIWHSTSPRVWSVAQHYGCS